MGQQGLSSTKRLGLRTSLVAFVLCIADLVCTLLYLHGATQGAGELPEVKSDVGIVLFSDFDRGGVDAETLRRMHFTKDLFERGWFDHILCAGGARPRRHLVGSELMKREFSAIGVPPDRVHAESRSNDTRSNVEEALKIARQKGWGKATLVTSPLQMVRVREIVRDRAASPALYLAAYSYAECHPRIGWTTLWWQTHYEWAARAVLRLLPGRLYKGLVNFLRP